MEDVVDIRGLRKSFGAFVALDGLDLHVRPGEVHGFLGPEVPGRPPPSAFPTTDVG